MAASHCEWREGRFELSAYRVDRAGLIGGDVPRDQVLDVGVGRCVLSACDRDQPPVFGVAEMDPDHRGHEPGPVGRLCCSTSMPAMNAAITTTAPRPAKRPSALTADNSRLRSVLSTSGDYPTRSVTVCVTVDRRSNDSGVRAPGGRADGGIGPARRPARSAFSVASFRTTGSRPTCGRGGIRRPFRAHWPGHTPVRRRSPGPRTSDQRPEAVAACRTPSCRRR